MQTIPSYVRFSLPPIAKRGLRIPPTPSSATFRKKNVASSGEDNILWREKA